MPLSTNLPDFKSSLKQGLLDELDSMNADSSPNQVLEAFVDKICDRVDEHIKSASVVIPGQPVGTLQ
jgi:hypothetical protein